MVLTPPRIIECFHLGLLSVLSRELGPGEFVLKGGANLRYFHGSSRYSEDIDLDVIRLKSWQVKEKIDRALGSQTLRILLRADGLETGEFSAPKQTETTQRWKVAILARGRQDPVRTKIELSHRAVDPRFALDAVPGERRLRIRNPSSDRPALPGRGSDRAESTCAGRPLPDPGPRCLRPGSAPAEPGGHRSGCQGARGHQEPGRRPGHGAPLRGIPGPGPALSGAGNLRLDRRQSNLGGNAGFRRRKAGGLRCRQLRPTVTCFAWACRW